jgi:hypothetical protein
MKKTDQGRTTETQDRARQPAAGQQREPSQTTTAPSGRSDQDSRTGPRRDTSREATTGSSLNVAPEVQTKFTNVIERQNVRSVTNVNFSVSVGSTIPRSVRLYDVPREIVVSNPEFRGKKYVVIRDEIVIIEPRTHKIVAIIPRSGRATTGTTDRQSTSARIQLAPEERRIIRETVINQQQVPRCEDVRISVGVELPHSIELRPFPEVVVREVPEIRSYQFCVMHQDVVIVDPREYRIVEVIK